MQVVATPKRLLLLQESQSKTITLLNAAPEADLNQRPKQRKNHSPVFSLFPSSEPHATNQLLVIVRLPKTELFFHRVAER